MGRAVLSDSAQFLLENKINDPPSSAERERTMMQKILVPTDGSPYSLRAAEYAARLASELSSKVSILHVSEYHPRVRARELVEEEEKIGMGILSKTKDVFDKAKVQVEVLKLEFGHPANIICSLAEREQFDLIVLGEKGAHEIGRFILGSVADRVAHHAPCPVLIIRQNRVGEARSHEQLTAQASLRQSEERLPSSRR